MQTGDFVAWLNSCFPSKRKVETLETSWWQNGKAPELFFSKHPFKWNIIKTQVQCGKSGADCWKRPKLWLCERDPQIEVQKEANMNTGGSKYECLRISSDPNSEALTPSADDGRLLDDPAYLEYINSNHLLFSEEWCLRSQEMVIVWLKGVSSGRANKQLLSLATGCELCTCVRALNSHQS